MKSFIIAILVLLILTAVLIFNNVFIIRRFDELLTYIDNEDFVAAKECFSKFRTTASVSISEEELSHLKELLTDCINGDNKMSAKEKARNIVAGLKNNEKLSFDNIF